MDRSEALKKAAVEWSEAIGRDKALVALIRGGFSTSTAEKILGGRYPYELRARKAEKLAKLMSKDGISLAGEKAS